MSLLARIGCALLTLWVVRAAAGPVVVDGFAALGDDDTAIPPDTMGAVGPDHLVAMLNTQVRIQTKSGDSVDTRSLQAFWTSGTGLSGDPFDPRILYDPGSRGWFAVAAANGDSATSQIWLAVSAGTDPTGAWSFFGFPADPGGQEWVDFPGLGVNQTWIAVTANMFSVGERGFRGAKMWVVDKASLLTGGLPVVSVFPTSFDAEPSFGTFGFTLQPALTNGGEAALYLVDTSLFTAGDASLYRLSKITGTGSAPVWSPLAGSVFPGTGVFAVQDDFSYDQIGASQQGVPSTCAGGPEAGEPCFVLDDCAPEAGGVCRRIDTGDGRVGASPIVRDGRLWFTHSGGWPWALPNRTSVFWYEIDPVAAEATGEPIVQSGVIDGGAGVHHLYPSIAVNAAGDVVVGCSRSSDTTFVAAVAATRVASDPPGTMGPVQNLKAGEDAYFKTFGGSFNRWGDYSAAAVDPSDDRSFWTIQEYAEARAGSDRWGTWWARLGDGGPTTTVTTTTSSTTSTMPLVCPASPRSGCVPAPRARLVADEQRPGHESLRLRLGGLAPGAGPAGFGDPLDGTTAYLVCLYDAAPVLVTTLVVERSGDTCRRRPCWRRTPTGTGYRYRDADATASGVRRLRLGTGRLRLAAGNDAGRGETALPVGTAGALTGAGAATVQLVASNARCVGATLTRVARADGTRFEARLP